ncbi:MAG TPA: hypothetical protein VLV88_04005 [Terriglobales bacterium]|nr:hypothetical protein [Terriglobales bacterium]
MNVGVQFFTFPLVLLTPAGFFLGGYEGAASRRLEELQLARGSFARVEVAVGRVRDALTRAAQEIQADTFVTGRNPQQGSSGRMRDLTYAKVRDAPCPLLSV